MAGSPCNQTLKFLRPETSLKHVCMRSLKLTSQKSEIFRKAWNIPLLMSNSECRHGVRVCYIPSKFPYQIRSSYCVQRNKPWADQSSILRIQREELTRYENLLGTWHMQFHCLWHPKFTFIGDVASCKHPLLIMVKVQLGLRMPMLSCSLYPQKYFAGEKVGTAQTQLHLGAASKLNRLLTSGSVRFRMVAIV